MRMTLNLQNIIPRFSLEEAARLTFEAGFDASDFYLGSMIDPDCEFNGAQWRSVAEQCGSIFQNSNVPIIQTHAPFSFKGWDDRATYENFIYPTIVQSIKVSAIMGAQYVVVHPLHYWRYAGNEQEIYEKNMAFYSSLIPIAKDYGIKICVENMFQRDKLRGNYIIHDTCSRPEEFCRYIDSLNSEYIVACLDIGHIGLPSGNVDPWEFIKILGHDRLQALHIHDNDFTNDQHYIPYSGLIDWDKVTQALGQIDYSGDFTFECLIKSMFKQPSVAQYPSLLRLISETGRHLMEQIDNNRPHADKA